MIRVTLTAAEREELGARTRTATPRERDRLEMLRLADAGWAIPRIAQHLGLHHQTVRRQIKRFLAGGFAAVPDHPRSGRPPTVTEAHLRAVEALLDAGGRTWTTRQLVAWLAQAQGVSVHPDHLRRLLRRRRFGWKRTVTSVAPKRRDPAAYEAKSAELEAHQAQAARAEIDDWFLDECGFAPTLPTGYSWGRLGVRLVVPYEAPQGRRVNVVGALAPFAPAGTRFVFRTRRKADGRFDAAALLAFVEQVVAAGTPGRRCVIVLDNYSVHHSQVVKEALPGLAERGVSLCYLPPYSPELNPIEALWKQVKYQDLPERSHPTDVALQAAVEAALAHRARKLAEATHHLPRSA